MSDEEHLNATERELEEALGALHPRPARIDRDRMMFEAGQRSVRPHHRRPIEWQVISGALAAALLVSVSLHRAPRHVERVVHVPVESRAITTMPERSGTTLTAATWDRTTDATVESAPPATSYLILRRHALSSDEPRNTADHRRAMTRPWTRAEPVTGIPDAGFFGRTRETSGERL